MALSKIAFAGLISASATLADFTFGTISGLQLSGDFNHPSLDTISGHFLYGASGEDYSQADFCNSIGLATDVDPVWEEINLDASDPPNYCDKPIPGLPDTVRISNAASVGGGDCGEGSVTGDAEVGGIVGSLIDTVASPDVAIGSCYHDFNCKYCATTGSQYASAVFTCLSGGQGGDYGSGIDGVNTDKADSDC